MKFLVKKFFKIKKNIQKHIGLYNIIIIIDTNNFIVTFTKLFNYCFRSLIVFLHSDLLFWCLLFERVKIPIVEVLKKFCVIVLRVLVLKSLVGRYFLCITIYMYCMYGWSSIEVKRHWETSRCWFSLYTTSKMCN